MKLLIILSIVAYGYADKLDRAYLPPVSAASAGGSPGDLIAPGAGVSGLRQGISSDSGRQPNSGAREQGSFTLSQGLPSSSGSQSESKTGQYQPSSYNGPFTQNGLGRDQSAESPSYGNANAPFKEANSPTFAPQIQNFGASSSPQTSSFNVIGQESFRPQLKGPSSQEFVQATEQGHGISVGQAYKPERAQAAADKNAEILKYINDNNGDTYIYSYETSNGIAVEESGDATNGVKAQGGYSYTDDDGQAYSITYTADENGFQPQGDHLPTPHPIPEEILKSIEENARAAAAGIQEGAYRPEEDIEDSPQRYNAGLTSFTKSQGATIKGSNQGLSPFQGSVNKQEQGNQNLVNQGVLGPNTARDQLGQGRPAQEQYKFGSNPIGSQGQTDQYQQGPGAISQIALGQLTGQISSGPSQISQKQSPGSIGYTYLQPQNTYGSPTQIGSSASDQNRPQIKSQVQINSPTGTRGSQSTFGFKSDNGPSPITSIGTLNKPDNQRTGSVSDFGQGGQNKINANEPLFKTSHIRPVNQGPTGLIESSQGYQNNPKANRPTFGFNNPADIASQPSQGYQYKPISNQPAFSAGNGINPGTSAYDGNIGLNQISRGPQFQQNGNIPSFPDNFETNQGSLPSGIQNIGSGQLGQANKPITGSSARPSQSTPQFGLESPAQHSFNSDGANSIQAPYQYNRPSQLFSPQQQQTGSPGQNTQRPGVSDLGFEGVNGQRPSFSSPGAQGTNGIISPDPQSVSGQEPSTNFPSSPGSQGFNGQRPSTTSPGGQTYNQQRPGASAPGPQIKNGQRPGAVTSGSQGYNGQGPSVSSPSSLGNNGQRPGLSATGYPNTSEQRPDAGLLGSGGRPSQGSQGAPEKFGGPRQPPSFSPQDGYKY